MKIVIVVDYVGFEFKNVFVEYICFFGYEVEDFGIDSLESVDYLNFVCVVGVKLKDGEVECGVLVCGIGLGMVMIVNKVLGVCVVSVSDIFLVKMCCVYNDVNVLVFGLCVVGFGLVKEFVDVYLMIVFDGDWYVCCVGMIEVD